MSNAVVSERQGLAGAGGDGRLDAGGREKGVGVRSSVEVAEGRSVITAADCAEE